MKGVNMLRCQMKDYLINLSRISHFHNEIWFNTNLIKYCYCKTGWGASKAKSEVPG